MPRIDGGLEIVTSDGSLAVQLQRTVHSLPSEFSVRVRGELEEHTLGSIMEGTLDRGINLKVESCRTRRRRGRQPLVHHRQRAAAAARMCASSSSATARS